MPPGETLTPDRIAMATIVGLSAAVAEREWAKFCDYDFRNARRDVDATWRNWCRTAIERQPGPARPRSRGTDPGPTGTPATRTGWVERQRQLEGELERVSPEQIDRIAAEAGPRRLGAAG